MSIKGPASTQNYVFNLELSYATLNATLQKVIEKSQNLAKVMEDHNLALTLESFFNPDKLKTKIMILENITKQVSTLLKRLNQLTERKSLLKQIKIYELKGLIEVLLKQTDMALQPPLDLSHSSDLMKTNTELTIQFTLSFKDRKSKERESNGEVKNRKTKRIVEIKK